MPEMLNTDFTHLQKIQVLPSGTGPTALLNHWRRRRRRRRRERQRERIGNIMIKEEIKNNKVKGHGEQRQADEKIMRGKINIRPFTILSYW
jgi:hypothetical protein